HAQHIASAHFDIRRRSGPALDIRIDMDHHAPRGRLVLQSREHLLLLLLDQLQRPALIASPTYGRGQACRSRTCLDLANQFVAALLFESAHLGPRETGALGIRCVTESSRAKEHIAQVLSLPKAVASWMSNFAFN